MSVQELPRVRLRVFFREKRPGVWIAQAVDHDLNAQGSSLEHARYTFALTVAGQIMLDIEAKRAPLSDLGPPPGELLADFERGWELKGPSELLMPGLPPMCAIRAQLDESRVYSG